MTSNEGDLNSDVDRGLPSVNKPNSNGLHQKIVTTIGGIFLVVSLVAVNGGFSAEDEQTKDSSHENPSTIGSVLGPAPDMPSTAPNYSANETSRSTQQGIIRTSNLAPAPPKYSSSNGSKTKTPYERKRSSSLLAFGGQPSSSTSSRSSPNTYSGNSHQLALETARSMMTPNTPAERADGLNAKLEPSQLNGARASVIADRHMFITKGTYLDCALETAISSDVAGMTSCRLTRDIYSTSGKVLLLERGSKVVGQYQNGIDRGQARIFVLWTRVETPTGVIINLDSPGMDSLGRSGHEGHVNHHFWQRFGGAILLSLIDDLGTWAAAKNSEGSNNQVQFGSTSQAAQDTAGIALQNSINIPPTLVKNQGDHINVFVARDLDFRGVYELRSSG